MTLKLEEGVKFTSQAYYKLRRWGTTIAGGNQSRIQLPITILSAQWGTNWIIWLRILITQREGTIPPIDVISPTPKNYKKHRDPAPGKVGRIGRDPESTHIHDNDKWDVSVIKSIPEMHASIQILRGIIFVTKSQMFRLHMSGPGEKAKCM